MNTLRGSKCYLAGNLEFEDWNFSISWRTEFEERVAPLGIKVLSPLKSVFKNFPKEAKDFTLQLKAALAAGDYNFVHEQSKLIRSKDLNLCDIATFLVINLNPSKPTFGTIDELITASRAKKPIFLIIKGGYTNIPIWLAGYVKPEFVFNSLNDVIDELFRLDSLPNSCLNNKYWRLLEKEYQ